VKSLIIAFCFASSAAVNPLAFGDEKDKVVDVSRDDAEMNAAIAKARSLLPHFWETQEKPKRGEEHFVLKVGIKGKDRTEHFWLNKIEKKDGKIFGTINNDPNYVLTVKLGQRIEIPPADISDWGYSRGEKMVGYYTVRVLLKTLPAEEAAELKAKIADP
jgi:uncharacterized protein YegJ (DUF2314 family)